MSSLLKDGSMDYHQDYATRSNHKAKRYYSQINSRNASPQKACKLQAGLLRMQIETNGNINPDWIIKVYKIL